MWQRKWQGTSENIGKSMYLEAWHLLLEGLTSQESSGESFLSVHSLELFSTVLKINIFTGIKT